MHTLCGVDLHTKDHRIKLKFCGCQVQNFRWGDIVESLTLYIFSKLVK